MTSLAINFGNPIVRLYEYVKNIQIIENKLIELNEDIPSNKYDSWSVPQLFLEKFKIVYFDSLKINVNNLYKAIINFEALHFEIDQSKRKTLIILPGFSGDSLKMTISRFYKYLDIIKNKGYSDVYIFNFTCIGGKEKKDFVGNLKCSNLQSILNYKIDNMYKKISSHLKNQIIKKKWKNISLLGRSAGGGLSLHLVFTYKLKVNQLNLATPGFDCNNEILDKIKNYHNTDLDIKLFWAEHDKKNDFYKKGGNQIDAVFKKYYKEKYKLLWDNCLFDCKRYPYMTHRISKQNYENLI